MPELEFLSWKRPTQAPATLVLLWFLQVQPWSVLLRPYQKRLPSALANAIPPSFSSLPQRPFLNVPKVPATLWVSFPHSSPSIVNNTSLPNYLLCVQCLHETKLQECRDCLFHIHTGLPSTCTAPNMHRHEINIVEWTGKSRESLWVLRERNGGGEDKIFFWLSNKWLCARQSTFIILIPQKHSSKSWAWVSLAPFYKCKDKDLSHYLSCQRTSECQQCQHSNPRWLVSKHQLFDWHPPESPSHLHPCLVLFHTGFWLYRWKS